MYNVFTFSDLKKYVERYPNLFYLTTTSVTTALAVYSHNSDTILFTLGGFGLGIVEGISVAAVSFMYYSRVEKGLKEIPDLSMLMLNVAYAGIATGSLLGLVTSQFFDVFPMVISNGLIITECSIAGILIGHYVDLCLGVKKGNEVSWLTVSTISGIMMGLPIAKGVIYSYEIIENFNKAMNVTMKYSNEIVEDCNELIKNCNEMINTTIEYPNKIKETFYKEINTTMEDFNKTIYTIRTIADYISDTASICFEKAEEYFIDIQNLIGIHEDKEQSLFDFNLN